MRLIEEYNKIKRDYYIDIHSDFESDFNNSNLTIKKFFEIAGKENWIQDLNIDTEFRSEHSLSLLYLGLILQKKLCLNLTIEIGEKSFPFIYYWSLICLYHDLGYSVENNTTEYFKLVNKNYSLNKPVRGPSYFNGIIERDLQCAYYRTVYFSQINKYLLEKQYKFNCKKIDNLSEGFNHGNTLTKRINSIKNVQVLFRNRKFCVCKNHYFKKTIDNYYIYRIKEFNVYDHGIVAGYTLYDRAIKNYCSKFNKENICEDDSIIDFIRDYRHFCIEQLTLFSYLADCIISHNIFMSTEEKEDTYVHYKLNELINAKKISIDNPILFLFDILDCVDPIKFFSKNLNVNSILESIDITFCENIISISLFDNSVINKNEFEMYCKKCLSLNEYININIENIDNKILFYLK